jgi:hypothetical protein
MAGNQINEMMKKMDLANNFKEFIVDSEGFKNVTS